jgi:hypothetical protein
MGVAMAAAISKVVGGISKDVLAQCVGSWEKVSDQDMAALLDNRAKSLPWEEDIDYIAKTNPPFEAFGVLGQAVVHWQKVMLDFLRYRWNKAKAVAGVPTSRVSGRAEARR